MVIFGLRKDIEKEIKMCKKIIKGFDGVDVELKYNFKWFYKCRYRGYPGFSDKYNVFKIPFLNLHWDLIPYSVELKFDKEGNFIGYFENEECIEVKEFIDILDTYFKQEYFREMMFDNEVSREKRIKAGRIFDKLSKKLKRKVEKYYKIKGE